MATPPLANATGNLYQQPNKAYTRVVDPNTETTAGQLSTLLRSDNPILQRARQRGAGLAAARGSTGNDSLFARAAEDAMGEQLIPVAGADAALYDRAANQNMGALNERGIADLNAGVSRANAATASATSKYSTDINAKLEQARLDQQKMQYDADAARRQAERDQDRSWTVADQDRAQRAAGRQQVASQVMETIFSDPSYWRDGKSAIDMADFFTNNFSSLWDNLFAEESGLGSGVLQSF